MKQLVLCEEIAREAHVGQKRRGGDDYIEHPRRVVDMVGVDVSKCVAWLHDVLEDTDLTTRDLLDRGVGDIIVMYVELLTKREGQDYWDYIRNLSEYKIIAKIKIADMVDNLSDNPTDNQKGKYKKAISFLLSKI